MTMTSNDNYDEDEVRITLHHPPTSRTDAISVPRSTTTLSDLSGYAAALLGIDASDDHDQGGGGAVLTRGTSLLHHPSRPDGGGERTLASCLGVSSSDGEVLVSAYSVREYDASSLLGAGAAAGRGGGVWRPPPPTTAPPSGVGGLDFSSLVAPPASSSTSSSTATTATSPVEWEGMNLDDAVLRNPNPVHLMTLLSDETRHPNLMKELNYHYPQVCRKLGEIRGDVPKMAEVWRQTTMKSTMSRFLRGNVERTKEAEMRNRLFADPMDAEANKYFGEKIRSENVRAQYERMMEEYPESMGRVLMLYVNTKVNGRPLQVFVDSGAQATIMSSACADRLDLLHLVDMRFAGVAVGVGTGKILGRIHVVELDIEGHLFPCSVTVMDSESGLGDKNMDCLFGLDMLRRHRCSIDLGANVLRFSIGRGEGETVLEAPFLHEKDLPISKGGTIDFDPEKSNKMVEKRMERMDTDEDDGGEEGSEAKEKEGGEDGRKRKGT